MDDSILVSGSSPFQTMDSSPIETIAANFTFATVELNRFAGARRVWFGMRRKLVAVRKTLRHVSEVARNGFERTVSQLEESLLDTALLGSDATTTPAGMSNAAAGSSSVGSKGNFTCRSGATGFFADPTSCSIYHWCVLGVLQSTHRCNAGLHFSASANACLWPKDADCKEI